MKDRGIPEGRFWIDAICINQEDLLERSSQVSFIIDIYDRAENVMVWLGRLLVFLGRR